MADLEHAAPAAAGANRRPRQPTSPDGGGGSATRPLTERAVLSLQRSHGNAFVARLLEPVQREGGFQLGGGRRSRFGLLGEENQLTLDPELQARMQAMQTVQEMLTPARVLAGLTRLPYSALPEPEPRTHPALAGAGAPEPEAAEADEGEAEEESRPGEAGDVFRAIAADPRVAAGISALGERVRTDWRNLGTGGQAAVVSTSVILGGLGLAGLLSSEQGREFAADFLSDRVLPVPGVPGLGVQLNLGGDNVMVGLHLDVGRYLPRQLGFGPNTGATPLGRGD